MHPTADLSQFKLENTIADLRKKAKSEQPNWHAMTGLYIDHDQQHLLTKYVGDTSKGAIISEKAPLLAKTFIGLLSKIESTEPRRYVLTMVEEMLDHNSDNVKFFLELQSENPKWPIAPFLQLLKDDAGDSLYQTYANAKILSTLLSRQLTYDDAVVKSVMEHFCKQITDSKEKRIPIIALKNLLTRDEFRPVFVDIGGLLRLSSVLHAEYEEFQRLENYTPPDLLPGTPPPVKKGEDVKPPGPNAQLVYETIYCLWLVSYRKNLAETKFVGTHAIKNVVSLIKAINKDKIKRVGLAFLRNLSPFANNNIEMIAANFHNVLKSFNLRKWGDPELQEDLETLSGTVEENILKLNSFDKYAAEVLSGKLVWTTPSHKSEKFWKANAPRFEAEDYRVLK
eukprot:TRINITY_DN1300_c0_g1_i1.p1 TRINITY_DN1300_c0_g1~~TRINITY_DN1300_c0_g1_i1.p1  ORF type:complete len:396 (-),score=59.19 TRINITY_DN1300_c0_g1_i1:65-1252(-)